MLVKKLDTEARFQQKRIDDAGYDIWGMIYDNNRWLKIEANEVIKIETGISLKIPKGCVGIIKERSSLGSKGLAVRAGVIDCSYTGEILVCIQNLTNSVTLLDLNKAIAQLIIVKYETVDLEFVDELPNTDRGDQGFGSTDKNAN